MPRDAFAAAKLRLAGEGPRPPRSGGPSLLLPLLSPCPRLRAANALLLPSGSWVLRAGGREVRPRAGAPGRPRLGGGDACAEAR